MRGDLGVGRGDDLRAVVVAAEVDLVAVVVRRVVRGGDHDAGRHAEVTHGEREHRCRQQAGEQHGPHARARHDLGRVAREHVGVLAAVVADHDRRRRAGRRTLDEVGRETRGRLGDEHPVHAIGPGGDRTAKAGGAEGEARVEAVGEVGGCLGVAAAHRRDDRGELVTGLGVGVLGDPRLGERDALRVAGIDVLRHPLVPSDGLQGGDDVREQLG